MRATRYEQIMVAQTEPPLAPDFWEEIEGLLHAATRRDWGQMIAISRSGPGLGERASSGKGRGSVPR